MEAVPAVSHEELCVDCPAEHREWVEQLRHGGPHRLVDISSNAAHHLQQAHAAISAAANSWACPPGDFFSVRGPDFQHTRAKIPGGEWLLRPLAFDFLQGPSPISRIMQHPARCRVRAALDAALLANPHSKHQPFVWVINQQLGNKTHHSLVYYYVSFGSPPAGSLMQRFLNGDDAFRNSRLKCLVRLPEAPKLVQVVVGERWPVCMIGKVMKCTYTRAKNYIEVDVDARSNMLTRTAVRLTFGLAPLCVVDMAFLLEGIESDELPERILAAVRLIKLETSSATYMDMSEALAHDHHQCTKAEPARGVLKGASRPSSRVKDPHARAVRLYKGPAPELEKAGDQVE